MKAGFPNQRNFCRSTVSTDWLLNPFEYERFDNISHVDCLEFENGRLCPELKGTDYFWQQVRAQGYYQTQQKFNDDLKKTKESYYTDIMECRKFAEEQDFPAAKTCLNEKGRNVWFEISDFSLNVKIRGGQ